MKELLDLIEKYTTRVERSGGQFSARDEGTLHGLRVALRIWRKHERRRNREQGGT